MLNWKAGRRIRLMVLSLGVALAFAPSLAAKETEDLQAIGGAFGLGDDEIAALLRGERVGGELDSSAENEVGLFAAFSTQAGPGFYRTRLLDRTGATDNVTVIARGAIEPQAADAFDALILPDDELDRLGEAEPGKNLNLSTREIERLRVAGGSGLAPPQRRERILGEFRLLLSRRAEDYLRDGLAGIEAYDRGGDRASPSAELGSAFDQLGATRLLAPAVYQSMAGFPREPSSGVTSHLEWILYEGDPRPLVVLSHRVFGVEADRLFLIERRFYSSHTLNSAQIISMAIPRDEGSLIFFGSRAFSDLFGGFLGGAGRGFGRKLMSSQIESLYEATVDLDPASARPQQAVP